MDRSLPKFNPSTATPESSEIETFGWSDFPLLMLSLQHHEADFRENSTWGYFCDTTSACTNVIDQVHSQPYATSLCNGVLSSIPEEVEEKLVATNCRLSSGNKVVKNLTVRAATTSETTKQLLSLIEPSRKRAKNALQRTVLSKAVKRANVRMQQRRFLLMTRDD
jgi:hypothetical protein